MELVFKGRITEIQETKSGEGQKGEWANTNFEVTESEPQNENYPQIGLFDFFKNGEYVKYSRDFGDYYKVGDEVEVHFNFKKNSYIKKDQTDGVFYKTSCWKLEKINNGQEQPPADAFEPANDLDSKEHDDLPF